MVSQVDICNEALVELSCNPITSLTQGTVEANTCSLLYTNTLTQMLMSNFWRFAKTRVELAAGPPPIFGGLQSYPLPADFLKVYTPDQGWNLANRDWKIEGRNLITYYKPPLHLIYVSNVTNTELFDPLFARSFSLYLASKMARPLAQSTELKAALYKEFQETIKFAKQCNAIDLSPVNAPESYLITGRVTYPTLAGTQVGW